MSKILIADDAQFIRLRLSKLLISNGYEIVEAKDGEEAVQVYREIRPDIVLMDMAMPRKNGMVALHEIRSFDPQAKVIMLTALGQQAIILRAVQAGAKDFLVKPYDVERLLKALKKALGTS